MSTFDFVLFSPALPDERAIDCYKRVVKGTFLDQDLIPIIDHEPPSTSTFSAYITPAVASLEEGLLHEIAHAIQLKKTEYPRRLKSWSSQIFVRPPEAINIQRPGIL